MIRSEMRGGTNSDDVSHELFSMQDGMRVRYDRPASELAELVTGYAIYAADAPAPMINWYLPAPAMISVLLDAGPVNVSVRNHHFGPLDRVSLYGPTSRAIRTVTTGGIAVGIGISALGWSQLIGPSAAAYHNRVVPLSSVLGNELGSKLQFGLDALTDDCGIKPLLDKVLVQSFRQEQPCTQKIRALTTLSVTDGVIETKDVADRLDLKDHELRRLSTRYFGMPPKLLLRRARFLRSFIRIVLEDGLTDYSRIDSSYFDSSHFLRDAGTFLGTTPRRFLMEDTTFLKASLRVRASVLNAPTQALQM